MNINNLELIKLENIKKISKLTMIRAKNKDSLPIWKIASAGKNHEKQDAESFPSCALSTLTL